LDGQPSKRRTIALPAFATQKTSLFGKRGSCCHLSKKLGILTGKETVMDFPEEFLYNEDHAWIRVEGNQATIGITHHAQELLEEILSVELPETGTVLEAGDAMATIESLQGMLDIYASLSGEVLEVNDSLLDSPDWINTSPYEDGWMVRLELIVPEELADLMDAQGYEDFVLGED
jgi:glycine cleavage system H protein